MAKDIWEETELYGIDELEDKYSDEEKKELLSKWESKYGPIIKYHFFGDMEFLTNFINKIPAEEWDKYVSNTINYKGGYAKKDEYDPKYVIVARRAVPSYESKPENFWTSNANEVFRGLSNEVRKEQRLHSVIMISTLEKLNQHGRVYTNRGVSDGEIALDPNKTFSDFLFRYKPRSELYSLQQYLNNGGKSREEVLEQLRETAVERAIAQGLPVNAEETSKNNSLYEEENEELTDDDSLKWISLDDIEEATSNQTLSDINSETQYANQIVQGKSNEKSKEKEQEDDVWEQGDDW